MGFQILRPATAFSNAPAKGQKRPRVQIEAHLRWLRSLPCLITGKRPVEACHIRYADPRYGKRDTGGQEKPHDFFVVPMHPDLHREQHEAGERAFWDKYNIDPCQVALALYSVTGDDDQADVILRSARNS